MDPSLAHLLTRLDVLASTVRLAVELRQRSDPDPSDPFRGLHISDEQARHLLDERAPIPVRCAELSGALTLAEADADAAVAAGHSIRLRAVERRCGLDELDISLLLVALAPDLDPRIERAYGYLHDDLTRRRASIGLALELCGASFTDSDGRARLTPHGPLVSHGLVEIDEPDRPFLTRPLRVPDAVAAFLLGDDSVDPLVTPFVERAVRRATANTEGLERAVAGGVRLIHVRDRSGTGATSWAASGLIAAGLEPLVIDLRRASDSEHPAAVIAAARRHCMLAGAALVAGPLDAIARGGGPDLPRLLTAPGVTVVAVDERPWDPAWSEQVPLTISAPRANKSASRLATYRLTPEQEERAERAARLLAMCDATEPTSSHYAAGVRAQNAAGLERLAVRIEPRATWDDLVATGDLMGQLVAVASRVRNRERVMSEWGMDHGASKGQGVTALFAGASGTGKTLAAEVIANDLGLDLYVIDLATVVDKYIGETEKNLDRIFAEADSVNGVLLFDEADAIFGKRSEVQDARDRHANVEVAYLLQRMERFEGVALLTTNLRANIDEAFLRRLDVLVDFPTPDAELRESLWRRHLPSTLPQDDSIDTGFLATSFDLTGGNISSVAMTAAFLAAANGNVVTMEHVIHATAREYRKLGRMCSSGEFGPWFEAVRQPQAGWADDSESRESH